MDNVKHNSIKKPRTRRGTRGKGSKGGKGDMNPEVSHKHSAKKESVPPNSPALDAGWVVVDDKDLGCNRIRLISNEDPLPEVGRLKC